MNSISSDNLLKIKKEYSQRLVKLFFTFFERGISLKTNREQFQNNFISQLERDPVKNLDNTIFKINYSQKFFEVFAKSCAFKNFLRDYNKVDLNPTSRFKKILGKNEFETSKIQFIKH